MATSPQLTYPFDILLSTVTINDLEYDYLAGPDMGGINRIIPMPTGNEAPLTNARNVPVGRIKPRSLNGQIAMVMISVFPNSVDATNLMALANAPQTGVGTPMNGVSVDISTIEDANGVSGSVVKSMSVQHVVFSASPYNFDAGRNAMVFQGIGWNLQFTTRDVAPLDETPVEQPEEDT